LKQRELEAIRRIGRSINNEINIQKDKFAVLTIKNHLNDLQQNIAIELAPYFDEGLISIQEEFKSYDSQEL